jgi:hypothetical protein
MTTTERRRSSPNVARSAPDLMLHLLAALASAYALAWWTFAGRTPLRSVDPGASDEEPAHHVQPRVIAWYDELSPSGQPPVQVPAGWRIVRRASAAPASTDAATPVPVRVSPSRAGRIRTRSS